MIKPILLKVVGHDKEETDAKQVFLQSPQVRVFPLSPGHYSIKYVEEKWTLNKETKNDSHWIFINASYVINLKAGGKILVDEDILELESKPRECPRCSNEPIEDTKDLCENCTEELVERWLEGYRSRAK